MDDELDEELPPHLAGFEALANYIVKACLETPEPRPGFWSAALGRNDIRLRPKGEHLEITVGGHYLCDGPLNLLAGAPPLAWADPSSDN